MYPTTICARCGQLVRASRTTGLPVTHGPAKDGMPLCLGVLTPGRPLPYRSYFRRQVQG